MFVNSKLIKEELKFTAGINPTASAGVSSSTLHSMALHTKFLANVQTGPLTTATSLVVSVWESTSSVWASAVATEVTASRTTTSVATAGSGFVQVEIDADVLNKPYVGIYVAKAGDTASAIAATIIRGGARFGNM
ncbi:hypothetical protein [Paenibacillus oryzisoli]|uniref:Uncharacterized protein n=1 Tax=Paenibacillus oryzisoli TaxID=1850517 RepID=A0A198AJN4_9BACL|nr:hypothetical protein [Paenibacillus oryzisoli]OAS21143.1 hypothetical protein A8708_30090 [Paenibacillus oryzisoli]